MKGLSVLKDQPDPIALPDEEYPDWVWTLTDAAKASGEAPATPKSSQAQGIENGFDFKAERRKLRQS
jgi:large subunit ribosomal protein L54